MIADLPVAIAAREPLKNRSCWGVTRPTATQAAKRVNAEQKLAPTNPTIKAVLSIVSNPLYVVSKIVLSSNQSSRFF
jgi:hypothetical protein